MSLQVLYQNPEWRGALRPEGRFPASFVAAASPWGLFSPPPHRLLHGDPWGSHSHTCEPGPWTLPS